MATDHVLRFAVGGPDAPRSAIWRLFTRRNEVYLGVRQIAGLHKVSFHSGGVCQEALTTAVATGAERSSRRWYRSSPATEIVELYRVVFVSRLALRLKPMTAIDAGKDILWLPPARHGAIGTARLFVGPTSGPVLPNALAWPLANGETVYFQYDIGPEPAGLIAGYSDAIQRVARIEPRVIGEPRAAITQPRGIFNMTCGDMHFALDVTAEVRVNVPVPVGAA